MGYNPTIMELSSFLIDSYEIEVQVEGASDPLTGKDSITFISQVDPATGLVTHPGRKEPAVTHSRETDRKFEKNNQIVFATHRLWVRKDIIITEFKHRIKGISGDGVIYDVLFVEEYPNEEGTELKEVILAENRN